MKQELSGEMEERIIAAATRSFVRKGSSGTSMQDIADEAGITRTSLNYYFRSKDKLFELVFDKVTQLVIPGFISILKSDLHIYEKFRKIIDVYFDMLTENPDFPMFFLHEVSVEPELLISIFIEKGLRPQDLKSLIKREMDAGNLRKTEPENIIMNLLGLIIFPFVAKPLLKDMIFNRDAEATAEFLLQRREYLKEYFIDSVKP